MLGTGEGCSEGALAGAGNDMCVNVKTETLVCVTNKVWCRAQCLPTGLSDAYLACDYQGRFRAVSFETVKLT